MKELENGRLYEIGCRILRAAGNELYVRKKNIKDTKQSQSYLNGRRG